MKITILSGGTGNNALYKGIKQFYPQADIKVLVNAYDSGKSTGICRKITNTLGVSDIRKNHSRLYSISKNPNENYMEFLEGRYSLGYNNEKSQIFEKLAYWGIIDKFILNAVNHFFELYREHKNKYCFEDFNIANIVYSSLFDLYGYEKTCELMTEFLGIENNVILNSFDNIYIKAVTKSGNIIEDEGDLVNYKNADDPIISIKYEQEDGSYFKPKLNDKAIKRIKDSDLIIISSGTFWSSIYPTLDYGEFYQYINASQAKKIWLMNNEQDKDAYGVSSNNFISIFENLGLELARFIIIENNEANELLKQKNDFYDIKYYNLGNEKGKHNSKLVSKAILKEYYNFGDEFILDFDDTIWARDWKTNEEAHKVSRENIQLINELNKKFIIISGNSYESIREKLKTIYGAYSLHNFRIPIVSDANAVLYKEDKNEGIIKDLQIDTNDIRLIEKFLKVYNFKVEFSSSLTYIKIKPIDDKYRKIICDYLNLIFETKRMLLKAHITGTTTIDILKYNNDKSMVLTETNWASKDATYIGDEIDHGNDSIISKWCRNYIKVKDVFETNILLRLMK